MILRMLSRTSLLHEQYVVDREGKKVGVILPFEQYRQMKEDLHDLAVIAERREEAPISLEQMKRRLEEDGLLRSSFSLRFTKT
jgi:PHD/YefM family antitoxin component YafN of YafNO toxin-antitoxin module